MRGFNLFDDDALRFDGSQPLQEGIREHQPALACGIGHCTARCRELLARPPAKIAFIRFHVPLHELAAPRVANSSLLRVIHRSSPVRCWNELPFGTALAANPAQGCGAALG